eukprot:jgi/Chrzof1/6018/Cz17g02020.t1
MHWVWRPSCLHVDSLTSSLGSVSTNDRVNDTYSQLADLLSTHVDGIKHSSHQQHPEYYKSNAVSNWV